MLYAFDGTWNVRDSKDAIEAIQPTQYGEDRTIRRETGETNVHRFREFYGREKTQYLQGVGTRFRRLGSAFGGAFGAGGKSRIRKMYRALAHNYFVKGDKEIDVVGFSRGAAIAVHFVNVLDRHGLRNPANKKHLAWKYYEGLGWTFRHPKPGPEDVRQPGVRFLGLWDTVASFGIPIRPFRNRLKSWWVNDVPRLVARSFHAMALDEVRATFSLVRPQRAKEKEQRKRHYEVWFRGVHSNVGGGYMDRGLSDIALAWMMELYLWTLEKEGGAPPEDFERALRMIEPEPKEAADWTGSSLETIEPDPDGELGRPADIRRQAWRELPPRPLIHHSVFRRTGNLVSDHYRSNRRLLRRTPKNAQVVYDPPFFYDRTPRQAAAGVARDAFLHAPVRASEWLKLGDEYIYRSDHWIAVGENRTEFSRGIRREGFVTIATEWLLAGRPSTPPEGLPRTVPDYAKEPVDAREAAVWVIDVLRSLEPYVASLRSFRAESVERDTAPRV